MNEQDRRRGEQRRGGARRDESGGRPRGDAPRAGKRSDGERGEARTDRRQPGGAGRAQQAGDGRRTGDGKQAGAAGGAQPVGAGRGKPSGTPGTGRGAAGRSATGRSATGRPATGRPGAAKGRGGVARPARPARQAQPTEPVRDVHVADGVRLQKVLASAGLGSRRACEELIAEGRVEVDGVQVRELGVRVDPARAVVHVDGMRLQLDTTRVTLALNKPRGVVSTMHDPEGRTSLTEFVANRSERLFHVGRLDADSEGLLLLTNDGELANRLAHPAHEVAKTYLVTVDGKVGGGVGNRLLHGIELDDGPARVDKYRIVDQTPNATMIEVVLHSGRNRIVRRMFDEVGHPITQLVRTRIGPVALGNLRPGTTRVLGRIELGSLMAAVGL